MRIIYRLKFDNDLGNEEHHASAKNLELLCLRFKVSAPLPLMIFISTLFKVGGCDQYELRIDLLICRWNFWNMARKRLPFSVRVKRKDGEV